MKYPLNKYIAILLLVFSSALSAQSISELESKVLKIKNSIIIQKNKIDSLNVLLMISNSHIKKHSGSDSQLKKVLAKSAEFSEEINSQTNYLKNLSNEFEKLRESLFYEIKKEINSLDQFEDKEKIVKLTQKQIIYAPLASELKFSPENILSFSSSDSNDELSHEIMKESINGAIEEVQIHIDKISLVYSEFTEITELNRMANEFTEDIEFDSDISTLSSITNKGNNRNLDGAKDGNTDDIYNEILNENLNNYNAIVNKLNIKELGGLNLTSSIFPKLQKNINVTNYLSYLNDVKSVLEKYKSILIQKRQKINE